MSLSTYYFTVDLDYVRHFRVKHGVILSATEKRRIVPFVGVKRICFLVKTHIGPHQQVPDMRIYRGFRCKDCNAAAKTRCKIVHFAGCLKIRDNIVRSAFQKLWTSSRNRISFGVMEETTINAGQALEVDLIMEESQQIMREFMGEQNADDDMLYKEMGWFSDSDFVKYPKRGIANVLSYNSQERLFSFLDFFKSHIRYARELRHDLRVLIIDEHSYGIRPIGDAHNQYAKCFARFVCFLIAFSHENSFNRLLNAEE